MTPSPAPKWPPVLDTEEIRSVLNSSDNSFKSFKFNFFKSFGDEILSKYLNFCMNIKINYILKVNYRTNFSYIQQIQLAILIFLHLSKFLKFLS